jgi:hypothetical protein
LRQDERDAGGALGADSAADAESVMVHRMRALPERLSALNKSILLVRQRNVRVLHSAGHARKECGFIWNANDEATASKAFDVLRASRLPSAPWQGRECVGKIISRVCGAQRLLH